MRGSSPTYPENPHLSDLKDYFLQLKKEDLPGHLQLEIGDGIRHYQRPATADAVPAAVTLLIHSTYGTPSIVFIERAHHIGPIQHRGQIAFPGGKKEKDETLKECAFRETEEEIGITLSMEEPIRPLTPLYVPVSNFLIYPFVVFQEKLPAFDLNPAEVKSIIDSPLTQLQNRYVIRKKDIHVREQVLKNVSYFPLDDKILWGASALIFSEFLYLLRGFKNHQQQAL